MEIRSCTSSGTSATPNRGLSKNRRLMDAGVCQLVEQYLAAETLGAQNQG